MWGVSAPNPPAIACARQYPHYPSFPDLHRSSPLFSALPQLFPIIFCIGRSFRRCFVITFHWKHSEAPLEACLGLSAVHLISIPCPVTVPPILHLLFQIRSFPF